MMPILFRNQFNSRLYVSKTLLIAFVACGIFLFPSVALLSAITPEKIIELTNNIRADNDLNPLTANQYLIKAANEKAQSIFREQDFAHNIGDKKFSAWVKDAGYDYVYVGENLAINFTESEDIVEAWMQSSLHKKNLLNAEFEEIGVATVKGAFEGSEAILVVQLFGTPVYRIDRLAASGFDPALDGLYAANNIAGEKYLTHAASREFDPWTLQEYYGKSHLPAQAKQEANNLFDQLLFPEIESYLIALYGGQIIVFSLLAALYLKLLRLHGHGGKSAVKSH